MRVDPDSITARAEELLAWADGVAPIDEGSAARVRLFCRDVNELVIAYEAESSGRRAMQANYARCLGIIESRLYADACARTPGHRPPAPGTPGTPEPVPAPARSIPDDL